MGSGSEIESGKGFDLLDAATVKAIPFLYLICPPFAPVPQANLGSVSLQQSVAVHGAPPALALLERFCYKSVSTGGVLVLPADKPNSINL